MSQPEVLPPASAESYAYLLGLYLGDGYLARAPRGVYHLRITLDAAYPRIIRHAAQTVRQLMPSNVVSIRPRREFAAVEVGCYSKRWPDLFPQHGAGKKHERRIVLERWQSAITRAHPEELVRGLIHSDGSRYLARQRRHGRIYAYPRYSFKNESPDILGLFCDHLNLVGIHWTRSNTNAIQIARRSSVAALDTFIGSKR